MTLEKYKELMSYECFIVFEAFIGRINENDILMKGYDVFLLFNEFKELIARKSGLKYTIIANQLFKIDQMMQRLDSFDNLILTKFFNRIWIKHKKTSEIAEKFMDLNLFLGIKPEYIDNLSHQIISEKEDEKEPTETELHEIERVETKVITED